MLDRLGFAKAMDESVRVFKRHLPYHESDHILTIAFNVMAGGSALEDIDRLREDESVLDLLGASRLPDPTTSGDFLRRLGAEEIVGLQEATNGLRREAWTSRLDRSERAVGIIDMDGSIVPTRGSKKRGMGMSYKGIWGYHPLRVTLANTGEPLYIVNRPGNATSHSGCVAWIERAIATCQGVFDQVLLRGDTAFPMTRSFDGWSDRGVKFVFGYKASENVRELALGLEASSFRELKRQPKYTVRTSSRAKREDVKETIVEERGYEDIRLLREHVAEVEYQPARCKRPYRLIVLRKDLEVVQGQQELFESRHLFYITNDETMSPEEVVAHANARCDQENVIEQLKNGVNALRVPVHDLNSNWAYMVIASLAWTFKAWFGLWQRRREDRRAVVRMEFKRFVCGVIRIPCQVVRTARQIQGRLLGFTAYARLLFMLHPRASGP